jgi:ribonucleoside-diphosphate reductase beta chain
MSDSLNLKKKVLTSMLNKKLKEHTEKKDETCIENYIETEKKKLKKVKKLKEEPILKVEMDRFTLFPIKHLDIWDLYQVHLKMDWRAEELDYTADIKDWDTLNNNEKYFIEHILAFFAGADGIVMENINSNFASEVQLPEARCFYAFQGHIESIHSLVYSLLIDTYIKDQERKKELFGAITKIECIKKKAEWAMKWLDTKNGSFAERLVAFAVVEGVFFSGSFCAIFWLKSRNLMVSGLGKSNEFIARDEGLHCLHAILLYEKLVNKLSKTKIHEIFNEAVEIEIEFITKALPCALIGMNNTLMSKYIKYVANFWMTKLTTSKGLKCAPLYKIDKNPFDFMDLNGLDGKTNFFEQRVTEYKKESLIGVDHFSNISDDF